MSIDEKFTSLIEIISTLREGCEEHLECSFRDRARIDALELRQKSDASHAGRMQARIEALERQIATIDFDCFVKAPDHGDLTATEVSLLKDARSYQAERDRQMGEPSAPEADDALWRPMNAREKRLFEIECELTQLANQQGLLRAERERLRGAS